MHETINCVLPVTQELFEREGCLLSDFQIIHINHEIDDVILFNEFLIKTGAKLVFISVPYKNKFSKKLNYDNVIFKRNSDLEYVPYVNGVQKYELKDTDLVMAVLKSYRYTLNNLIDKRKKLIIIQDGGFVALSKDTYNLDQLIGCVEQTESGARMFENEFKKRDKLFPVITIARSRIKTQYESQFIAQRVFEETNLLFYEMNDFLKFRKIIIGGYGQIGRRVAQLYKQAGTQVIVYDTNEKLKELSELDGFRFIEKIKSTDIEDSYCYIGCSGKRSFQLKDLVRFLNSKKSSYYLVSASSKRIEFLDVISFFEGNDVIYKRKARSEYEELKSIKNIKLTKNQIGLTYSFDYMGRTKTIILIAEGTPVNFYRESSNSVPSKAIDPIQAIIALSAIRLAKNSDLENKIYFVGDPNTDRLMDIDEEKIMISWASVNSISVYSNNILSQFNPHPYYINPSIINK